MEMSLPVPIPSPELPPFTSHYEKIAALPPCSLLQDPSGVFTITCIISLCAWGVYSDSTWTRDHSTGSCVNGLGGGAILANCGSGSQITWDGIYFPITVKEGNTSCKAPLDICRTLPACCWVDDLSVMAFLQTVKNSFKACTCMTQIMTSIKQQRYW